MQLLIHAGKRGPLAWSYRGCYHQRGRVMCILHHGVSCLSLRSILLLTQQLTTFSKWKHVAKLRWPLCILSWNQWNVFGINTTQRDVLQSRIDKKKSALFLPIGWHFWVPGHFECILPKGPYPPCLRMADRALLAGYPRFLLTNSLGGDYWSFVRKFIHFGFFFFCKSTC